VQFEIVTVLMRSGLMFAVMIDYKIGSKTHEWIQYPLLPGGRLVDHVALEDDKILMVSKDKKLFSFTYEVELSNKKLENSCREMTKLAQAEQLDGSKITGIEKVWISRVGDSKLLNAWIVSCSTTLGPAVCSCGSETMIGRPSVEETDINRIMRLEYESSMT
jgi:hypothetical protein